MRFIVLGGGCYGTFYGRQLLRARAASVLAVDEIVIVDRAAEPQALCELGRDPVLRFEREDWGEYLGAYLPTLDESATDQLVTPPFTPHLAMVWILDRLREERPELGWTLEPFRRFPGTPFEAQAEGGPLVVSHADWICPVHCIEPEVCPKTRGPRFWDLDSTVRTFATELEGAGQPIDQVHLFHCHHVAYGVGAYPAARIPRALGGILEGVEAIGPGDRARFLVGTVSHCHGALHLLSAELA